MNSQLQHEFLLELLNLVRSSRKRIVLGLRNLGVENQEAIDQLVWDELKTIVHSFLVTLDGGTELAEKGLITITGDDGIEFDSFLHELVFENLDDGE